MSNTVKVLLGAAFGLVLLVRCSGPSDIPPRDSSVRSWHEAGTLHKATVSEWWEAPVWDHVATSADFASVAAKKQGRSIESMDDLRPLAQEIRECINAAAKRPTSGHRRISEIAAVCLVMMEKSTD